MNPPRVYELTSPSNHRTRRITKIVQSMFPPPEAMSSYSGLRTTDPYDANSRRWVGNAEKICGAIHLLELEAPSSMPRCISIQPIGVETKSIRSFSRFVRFPGLTNHV